MAAEAGADALAAALAGTGDRCLRIFVAGAVTHVGKTTVCLSILAALRRAGIPAKQLAYIKPATQCEAPDLLMRWCEEEGVEHCAGEFAPLVFYQGFTRSFLAGEQGTSATWQQKIAERVDKMAEGRRVVIVDGVGFPAVGSIVGVDNADVAKAARAPVLLVCKSGVGAAVDSFSLTSTYFLAKGVPVLGAVFNLGELDGFNSWDKCAPNISAWFASSPGRRERYYGVVPMQKDLDGLRESIMQISERRALELADLNASHFAAHVDLPGLITDAAADAWNRSSGQAAPPARAAAPTPAPAAEGQPLVFQPKARDAVAAAAKLAGARGGG